MWGWRGGVGERVRVGGVGGLRAPFLACARVRGLGWPACLVVSRGGYSKAGREPACLVLSPLFLLFVWSGRRDLNPLPSPWEGDALPVELRPQAYIPRLSVALLFVCAWLSLGFGADDGV